MITNKKILITGGAGFIGCHLAKRFADDNTVTLFDNFRRDSLQYADDLRNHDNVSVVKGDILDVELLDKTMSDTDIVIHLAAIAGVSSYYNESVRTLRTNIIGTLNVLESMVKTKTKTMIDFSTSEVYGIDADHVDEEHRHGIGPVSQKRWVYAVSKLASEHFTLRYGEENNLNCACVRPFNIYGPGQTGEGAIRNFAHALLNGENPTIYGDGKDVRAWCFVSDMVDAVELMIENPSSWGQSFNIGNPEAAATTTELAEMLVDVHGSGKIDYVPAEHAPIRLRIPDISRAQKTLNYSPKISLRDGLKVSLDWYKENSL